MKLAEEGIFVIENCIPLSLQDTIENFYFSDEYEFNTDWIGKTDATIIKPENGPILRDFEFDLFEPVVKNCLKKISLDYSKEKVIFSRIMIQNVLEKSVVNHIHVDSEKNSCSLVYYINDSDGDTVFFDKTKENFPYSLYQKFTQTKDWYKNQEKFFDKIIFRNSPKKGTAVIFDGSIYHASSTPTKGKRAIFNFCYSKE